jgi:Arc/MetJ-type ribon-helix-helix transcriptional regulator
MGSITVKVPDDLEADLEEYAVESGQFMNQSELVRTALRRYFEDHPLRLSEWSRREIEISERQIENGETVSHDEVKRRLGMD